MAPARPWLAPLLALALALGAPGLPAYQAAAQSLGRVPLAGARVPQPAGWAVALNQLAGRLEADPSLSLSAPGLARVLGHLRLELAVRPNSAGALALVSKLAPAMQRDPAAFSKLAAAKQAELAAEAAREVAAELGPLASAAVARSQGGRPAKEDSESVKSLSGAWFYLEPKQAAEFRELARPAANRSPITQARNLARRLLGRPARPETDPRAAAAEDRTVAAELESAFRGAEAAVRLQPPDLSRPKARELTREVLAPVSARALDAGAARLGERGIDPEKLWSKLLSSNTESFGEAAGRPLFETLRSAGAWTDFVAAVSMHAAERLAGSATDAARKSLTKIGYSTHYRFALPSWSPQAASYASVADWARARFAGERDLSEYGRQVFRFGGVPILVTKDFPKLAGTSAIALGLLVAVMSPWAGPWVLLAQTAVGMSLMLFGILVHEWGHASVARALGLEVLGITFRARGGAAVVQSSFRNPRQEALISAAGPAVTLVFAALCLLLAGWTRGTELAWLSPVFYSQALFQAFGFAINAVPVVPNDGGRVLRALLAGWLGDHYLATRWASRIGIALAISAVLVSLPATSLWGPAALALAFVGYSLAPGARKAAKHPGTRLLEEGPASPER